MSAVSKSSLKSPITNHGILYSDATFLRCVHHLQGCLAKWNTNVFGQVAQNKKCIRAWLLGTQQALCHQPSHFLLQLEQHLIAQYNAILYQEFLLWLMKSRIMWLSYGDTNTHFFHVQAKIKRTSQHIPTLKDESEEWLQGFDLHNHVTTHFQCLFQSGLLGASLPPPQMLFSSSDFNPQALCSTLIHFPDKEEICATLFAMHPLKFMGPDGFHAYFYQHNWQIVGADIVKFIQTLFITARIPEDLTQIKLVLIPKVPNPKFVTQLRPISLCNTLYKLLTKLLVNRLKPFLPAMIHPAQSGFVLGRWATDNYILMQELRHFIHHQ